MMDNLSTVAVSSGIVTAPCAFARRASRWLARKQHTVPRELVSGKCSICIVSPYGATVYAILILSLRERFLDFVREVYVAFGDRAGIVRTARNVYLVPAT